jgi:Transposase DDE domain
VILGISSEVLLVAGYAAFLVLVAAGLEALGRHSHRRSELFHVTGFQYRRELDLWECPTGHQLPRSETDYRRRIVRYRAPSHVCNTCPSKPACTDSDKGREIERQVDSWLSSEIRRFHRAVSVALLLLAALILVAQTLHHHQGHELVVLCFLLGSIGVIGKRLLAALREQ